MPELAYLSYNDCGSGQPILFIHGWCMSSEIWGFQREDMAAHYRFLALDLHGHGASGLPVTRKNGFAAYADDIVMLMEQLNLQEVIAVGWSLGAQALLKAYARLKGRLAAVVLVGATPRFTAAPHFPYGLQAKEAEGMRLKVRRNLGRALEGFHRNLFAPGELDEPVHAKQVAQVLERVAMPSPEAALEGLDGLMQEELLVEATRLDVPTLLLHGDQDRVCLPQASRWLEQHIIGCQRYTFAGCGHAPFLSRPAAFNQALLTFVEELRRHD